MKKLNIYVSSDVGLVRNNNEDIIMAGSGLYRDNEWRSEGMVLADNERFAVAVCDGMGGHNAGEVASEDVATQLRNFISKLPADLTSEELVAKIKTWQKEEHDYLLQRGIEETELKGMGTTLVGWIYYNNHIIWLNCGDSRIYRYRNGILKQLSSDHSLFNITHRPQDSHIILNCMGGGVETTYIDIEEITDTHVSGDLYLLCSDGLTDMLTDVEIERFLSRGERAKELTQEACASGGRDNVSVCIVELI